MTFKQFQKKCRWAYKQILRNGAKVFYCKVLPHETLPNAQAECKKENCALWGFLR